MSIRRVLRSGRVWGWTGAIAFVIVGIAAAFWFAQPSAVSKKEAGPRPKPSAPPDLEKLRPAFAAGLEALQRGDGETAVRRFNSFDFGTRLVEQYRLYFLAKAHQLAGDHKAARGVLALLWSGGPTLAYTPDAGLNLAALYVAGADWRHAAAVYRSLAVRQDAAAVAAAARWSAIETSFYADDLAGMLELARGIAVNEPRSPQASPAIAVVRSLSGISDVAAIRLSSRERIARAVSLLRDGAPTNALEELIAIDRSKLPDDLRDAAALNQGLALSQMRRWEQSNRLLEPLTSGSYKYAVPALYHAARNYRFLAASINPIVFKTVIEKKRVGTVRVPANGKKKAVIKPKYANVKRSVPTIDPAKKARKDAYERLSAERLRDLLLLPIAVPIRIEALNNLIGVAEARNEDAGERELIEQLVRVSPNADAGLQHYWDKGWAAYLRGDLAGATDAFTFIETTYGNPNVKRQARYWHARTMEYAGQREESFAVYRELAAAPYDDLYALNARAHGAPGPGQQVNPLILARPDWPAIANQEMPAELRLAYELNALSDARDARIEIQKNAQPSNQRYANALLADLYYSGGSLDLAFRYLRQAFPKLATVEQNDVPQYFLKMYYPLKYESAIRKYSERNKLDPYFVMAIILQESGYNAAAKSRVGATGLMQLMPATGQELGSRLHGAFRTSRLEESEMNVEIGTLHLRHLFQLFGGNEQLVAAAYNSGQGNVQKWRRQTRRPLDEFLESIPFPETRNYVKRITMLTSSYRVFNRG
jgi:soluble lytic murein transglycosylase-like protein